MKNILVLSLAVLFAAFFVSPTAAAPAKVYFNFATTNDSPTLTNIIRSISGTNSGGSGVVTNVPSSATIQSNAFVGSFTGNGAGITNAASDRVPTNNGTMWGATNHSSNFTIGGPGAGNSAGLVMWSDSAGVYGRTIWELDGDLHFQPVAGDFDAVANGYYLQASDVFSLGGVSGQYSAPATYANLSGATNANAAILFGSGLIPTARLGTGVADGTTFLSGDQTWKSVVGGSAYYGPQFTNSVHYGVTTFGTNESSGVLYIYPDGTRRYTNSTSGYSDVFTNGQTTIYGGPSTTSVSNLDIGGRLTLAQPLTNTVSISNAWGTAGLNLNTNGTIDGNLNGKALTFGDSSGGGAMNGVDLQLQCSTGNLLFDVPVAAVTWGGGFKGLVESGGMTNAAGSRVAYLSDISGTGSTNITDQAGGTYTAVLKNALVETNLTTGTLTVTNGFIARGPIYPVGSMANGDVQFWNSNAIVYLIRKSTSGTVTTNLITTDPAQ